MARIKSVAAMIAVLALPVIVALTGLLFVPDAPPPKVHPTVQISEPLQPTTSTTAPTPTPSPTPLPPPPPIGDDDDDGDDDGGGDGGGDDDG